MILLPILLVYVFIVLWLIIVFLNVEECLIYITSAEALMCYQKWLWSAFINSIKDCFLRCILINEGGVLSWYFALFVCNYACFGRLVLYADSWHLLSHRLNCLLLHIKLIQLKSIRCLLICIKIAIVSEGRLRSFNIWGIGFFN